MNVRVLVFGPEAAAAGRDHVAVTLGADRSCAAVLRAVGEAAPELRSRLGGARIAVNHCFATPEQAVSENDEVTLIGLVSGG